MHASVHARTGGGARPSLARTPHGRTRGASVWTTQLYWPELIDKDGVRG